MREGSIMSLDYKTPKPRTIGILILLFIALIVLWGTFVIIPAGHRGVCLWWGSVEKRIMGEGLNFIVPIADSRLPAPHPAIGFR